MLMKLSLVICILCAFVLVGCNKSETHETTNSTANANKPASTSSPATASTSPASTTTSAAKVGVPECDDFIAKYDACVSTHVPEAVRAQYRASIETWRSQWAKMAANPQTKAGLVQACKTVLEQQKTALKSYNCTF
jgi:hypothetical protein